MHIIQMGPVLIIKVFFNIFWSVGVSTKVVWPLNTISCAFPVGQFVDCGFYFMRTQGLSYGNTLYMQLLDFNFVCKGWLAGYSYGWLGCNEYV